MKALVSAFNQEKALVGTFSMIVQPVVQPMEHYTALVWTVGTDNQDIRDQPRTTHYPVIQSYAASS